MSKSPTVYVPEEDRLYRFEPEDGIYMQQRKQRLATLLSSVMRECVQKPAFLLYRSCQHRGYRPV